MAAQELRKEASNINPIQKYSLGPQKGQLGLMKNVLTMSPKDRIAISNGLRAPTFGD